MRRNYEAWDMDKVIGFYKKSRNKPEDIYESERVFFFPLVRSVRSVLDVGCAAGGFYNSVRKVNRKAKYTGLDVSEKMIRTAKAIFPRVDFRLTSGNKLAFADNSFELVMSLGVMHHVPDYRSFMQECYRVASRYCLFDLPRLLPKRSRSDRKESFMILKERFHSNEAVNASSTKVPYVLADAGEVFDFLCNKLKPSRIMAKGYFGKCDKSIKTNAKDVCFTCVCLKKDIAKTNRKVEVIADLPKIVLDRLKDKGMDVKEPFEWAIR